MKPTTLAVPFLLALSACTTPWSDELVVDGVRLTEKHREVLDLPSALPEGLRVSSAMGDLTVRLQTAGGNVVEATLHERTPNDARLVYEDGVLSAVSASGEPCALGDVSIYCTSLSDLYLSTGMGDVRVDAVPISGDLEAKTGTGDIHLLQTGSSERVVANTGMGDVQVEALSAETLTAESGMGDIALDEVLAKTAQCASGMGDVDVSDSSFGDLRATTGMGDIDCRQTSYDHADLDSGMGKVRRSQVTREVE